MGILFKQIYPLSHKQKSPREEAIWARGVSYSKLHRNQGECGSWL